MLKNFISLISALVLLAGLNTFALAQPYVALDCETKTLDGFTGTFDCAAAQGGLASGPITAAPATLNPVTSSDTASGQLIDYAIGAGSEEAYALIGGGMAAMTEVNEAGTAVTFHLREGLKFSDGSPVTTDDILYWFHDVVFNPNLPNSWSSTLTCIDGTPFDVSVDGSAVTVTCAEPFRTFQSNAGNLHVHSKQMAFDLIADQGIPTEDGVTGPRPLQEFMGLGIDISLIRGMAPFVMTEFVSDQFANYERNPHFYMVDSNGMQLPYLDEVTFFIYPTNGQNLALSAFLNGQIDFYEIRSEDIAPILGQAAAGSFSVNGDIDDGSPDTGTEFLILNYDDENTNLAAVNRNASVRRALSLSVDRIAMINNVLLGIGTPTFVNTTLAGSSSAAANQFYIGRNNTCEDFIASGLASADTCVNGVWSSEEGLSMKVIALPPPDADFIEHLSCLNDYAGCVANANALLDGLGIVDTDGDGIRNIPADFDGYGNPGGNWDLQLTTNVGNTTREQQIAILCNSWSQLSVNCSTNPISFSTLVVQLLGLDGATWTGGIRIGFTGGDPAGGVNIYQCGAALYAWHLSCDPSATSGSTAQIADGGGSVEAGFDAGFGATNVPDAQVGFDAMQRAWIRTEPTIQLVQDNELFAVRTDRICNDDRQDDERYEVTYRVDIAGNEGTCTSNIGR